MIATSPLITRNELRQLDSKADQWLHLHDADWLEQNSPLSRKTAPSWVDCDNEYLEGVENAVKVIRDSPGIPRWISVLSVGKKAGIAKPYTRLTSDLLPKTKAFVAANIERWNNGRNGKSYGLSGKCVSGANYLRCIKSGTHRILRIKNASWINLS